MGLSEFYRMLTKLDYDVNRISSSDNILYLPGTVYFDNLAFSCRYLFRKGQADGTSTDASYKLSIIELLNK